MAQGLDGLRAALTEGKITPKVFAKVRRTSAVEVHLKCI
jgi:hypothetical protein